MPGSTARSWSVRRVVGVVAELLDAVGEGGVGEHEGDALHRPVEAALGAASRMACGDVLAAGESLERLAVVVVERLDDGRQLVVGRRPQSAVEQPERLQAGLHLVHGARRYRRTGARASLAARLALWRWPQSRWTTSTRSTRTASTPSTISASTSPTSEFLVLVGPSGCGKSTALRMVAGLETITGGEMRIGDRVVNDVEPKDRDIAMVFQNYALYPHMTVFDNIGFALKLARVPKEEIDTRVRKAAAILELEPYLDRKPGQLSGGQRQRVAMGRAIVRQPAAFLMDEPLSNLDAKLRVQMRAEIARLQRDLGVTTFYVTHDQVEAMTMGDRVAVLKDGYLQQVDTPQNLYDKPVNVFVAAFIGSPSMNLYDGALHRRRATAASVEIGSQTVAARPGDAGEAAGAARLRRQARRRRHPPRGLRGRRGRHRRRRRPPHQGRRQARRGARLGADGALRDRRQDASTPATPTRPRSCPARATPTPSPASARGRGCASTTTSTIAVATENLHFFDAQTHEAIWS